MNCLTCVVVASITILYLVFAVLTTWEGYEAFPVSFRLPENVKPVHYQITLVPYLMPEDGSQQFTFDGDVEIIIKPQKSTRTIILHSKNLNYTVRQYWRIDKPNLVWDLDTYRYNNEMEQIIYNLTTSLKPHFEYVFHFVYCGYLNDNNIGFYHSSYINKKKEKTWLAATLFQPNYARRAFPCWDEPKFKATFTLQIVRRKSMRSFSNTKILSEMYNSQSDYTMDIYDLTPHMSTYMLAFIVSNELDEHNEDKFSILSRPEYCNQIKFCSENGPKILKSLGEYFTISYQKLGIPKMQLAFIADYNFRGMEHWGLPIFRESFVLSAENQTSLHFQQNIAQLMAHEQAHMWFGNLVTCDWWNFAWLNEGFATYFQYHLKNLLLFDMYELQKQFVIDKLQNIMLIDSTQKTNALSIEIINSSENIMRGMSKISYQKGASIIRMFNNIMGEKNFQKALISYLSENSYTNTVPMNLLNAFKKYWPIAFRNFADDIFYSFTTQVGYPVITATLTNGSLVINQTRFLLKDNDGFDATLVYTVPITYTTNVDKDFENTSTKLVLNATTATINVGSHIDWVILNIQESGYYRVNYDDNTWSKINRALLSYNWGEIHEVNRAQIVDDLFNLGRAGTIKYSIVLSIMEYLMTEIHYLPWTAAFNGYSYLTIRLGIHTEHFAVYIRKLTEKAYNQLGFDEGAYDTTLEIYARTKILSWSCRYGNSDCISKVKTIFYKFTSADVPVPVNIRSVVYCVAVREGGRWEYDFLYSKYLKELIVSEKLLILTSLGCMKQQMLIENFFTRILTVQVNQRDKLSALTSLFRKNNENVNTVFQLIIENHELLAKSMNGYYYVATLIADLATYFTESMQKEKLDEFISLNGRKFGKHIVILNDAMKNVIENLIWSKRRLHFFKEYLTKFVVKHSLMSSLN